MNDEQLSQSPNRQAEQDSDAPQNGSASIDDANGVVGQGQEFIAGSVGKAQVGDIDAPTQGFPSPVAEGNTTPELATRDSEPQPSMEPAQADALTSYHPVETVGETPEQGVEAKAEGETQAAAQAAIEAPAQPEAPMPAEASAESSAPEGTEEAGASEGESEELQVVRTTRDRRLNEMAPNASMEDLLKASEQQYRALKHGDVIEGTVMKLDRDEILVDIGSKSEGIIPSHELQSLTEEERANMQIGDEVLVSVVQPENSEGHAILSLDRARQEKSWRDLQRKFEAGEVIQAPVSGYNKGGLLVNLGGVRGFVPASQVSSILPNEANKQAEMAKLQGTALPLKIIEINRGRNRLILSERQAVQEQRESMRTRLLRELEPGQIRPGTVSSICDFGAFVDIGGADGLIHLSELSWKRVSHPSDVLKVGDRINVYVLSVDPNERKIALSLKRTQPEPWSTITDNYHLGQVVRGTITQLTNFGAFARLEDGIEGLIHVSELAEGRVAHPKNVVHEGQVLDLKVIRIDPAKKRIGLSLKRVNEDAEAAQEAASGPVDEDTAQEYAVAGQGAPSLTEAGAQAPAQQAAPQAQTQQPRPQQPQRDRERESQGRPSRAQVSNFEIPQTDEDEPMGVMAQAFAALAQQRQAGGRGRGATAEAEETETEEPTDSGATAATAATVEEPEASIPSAEAVSAAEVETQPVEAETEPEAATEPAAQAAPEPVAAAEAAPEVTTPEAAESASDEAEDAGEADAGAVEASGADLSTGGPGASEVLASNTAASETDDGAPSGSEGEPSTADSATLEPTEQSVVTGTEGETGDEETLG